MRKVWTTFLLMFSLFFLCNFSYAATGTITVIDNQGNETVYIDDDNERLTSDVSYTFDLRQYSWTANYDSYTLVREGLLYRIRFFNMIDGLEFYFDDDAIHNPSTEYSILQPFLNGSAYTSLKTAYLTYNDGTFFSNTGTSNFNERTANYGTGSYANIYLGIKILDSSVPIKNGIFAGSFTSKFDPNITCTLTDIVLYDSYFGSETSIKMENPLTDDEIKSILEIFLESVNNYGVPEDYERFVLTYNVGEDSYSGFVYSKYADISVKYMDRNVETNFFEYFLDGVGPFYSFFMYSDNRPLNYKFNFFNKPSIIKFKSNSDNSAFIFEKIYDLDDKIYSLSDDTDNSDLLYLSTENEPIIYTSDKIYSLFYVGEWLGSYHFELDENTSLDYREFIDESGEVIDTTVSTIQSSVETDINVLSFIGLFFSFLFSCVSFVIRFFTFLITFINVPASTTILPQEFVQGIDWIHLFAFGEILLWDIFSILFLVLLSIFLVNLIHSH